MRKRLHARPIVLSVLSLVLMASVLWAANPPSVSPAQAPAREGTGSKMALWQAVMLGVVEGLTEYLPVSSTGHLLLAERVMGIGADPSDAPGEDDKTREAAEAYAICIQAGAIIAVLGLYSKRVIQMFKGFLGKDRAGLQMLFNIVAAFLPAAVIGVLFNKAIKSYLFGIWPVIAAWFIGGVAILVVERSRRGQGNRAPRGKPLDALTVRMALLIGIAQCIAMWPGVSRSLVTIVGGVMAGLSLAASVEFSFLLGVVTLGAATAYDALKHGQAMVQTFDALALAAGLISAFVFAVLSVKWMVSYLNRHGMAIFGYYRVALALLVAVMIVVGAF